MQNAAFIQRLNSHWRIRNAAVFFQIPAGNGVFRNEKPSERPTFDQVTTLLETMLMEDTPYFDPGLLDESKAYYNVLPEEEIVVETT